MRRQLLIPLLAGLLFQLSGAGAQPTLKDDILQTLKLSIEDLDDFKGVKITGVDLKPGELVELSGQVPSSAIKPRLKDLCETVLKNAVEGKTLKGGPYKVDLVGMVDLSLPPEKRLIEVLNTRLFGKDKPIQGKLTDAVISPEGVVTLKGSVLAEEMKAVLAAEGKKLLDDAVKAKTLPGPYTRLDTTGVRRTPNEVFGILEASLPDAPGLEGFRLVFAELTPDGVLRLAGLAASEDQKQAVKKQAVAVMNNAIQSGALPMGTKFETVDVARVRVGSSKVDELLVLESTLKTRPDRVVRAQLYLPDRGELHLTGIVESEASKKQIIDEMKKFPGVKVVDASKVLVRQSSGLQPGEPAGTLLDAYDALGRNASQEVLQAATASIRNAAPTSTASVNSWYMRAAAHMMLGRRQEALGDLRVAQALAQQVVGGDGYYSTLERFQGPLRIQMSDLMREGARGVICNDP